jgi:hypothetical protein
MKRTLLGVVLLLFGTSLMAQSAAEIFAETITPRDLEAHLTFLADDLLEGRATTKRGQKLAAHYIRSQFMRAGLPGGMPDGSFYQTYYLNRVNINSGSMKVGKSSFDYGDDFIPMMGGTPPAKIDGDVVFVGYGMEEDSYNNLKGLDLNGKVVFLLAGSPQDMEEEGNMFQRFQGWAARAEGIEAKGAKAIVYVLPNQAFRVLKRFSRRSRVVASEESGDGTPMLGVTENVAEALFKTAKTDLSSVKSGLESSASVPALKFKKLNFSATCDVDKSSDAAENVLAYLEGTDKKDEVIVLTAHYDHIGVNDNGDINNGADDDGSGTSAIMEVAEAFAMAAKRGYRPRRSILFMTVSGEEIGLLGSAFYADNPIYPLENTVANLNIDMIGRIDPQYEGTKDSARYVYIIGSDKLSTDLHELSEEMNDRYTGITLDYKYNDPKDPNRYYYRSDHYNFASRGIPVIFYFTGTHADYHKPTDTVEKINFDKMALISQLVFHTAWELANRKDRIVVDKAGD